MFFYLKTIRKDKKIAITI